MPYMPIDTVLSIIRKSKIGIFMGDITTTPRYNKAISMKVLEYMTQSVSVIINKVDMLSELVNKADSGWIIDYDSKELYQLLKTTLKNDAILNEKGRNGYEYLLKNMVWENQEFELFKAVFGD
jgi:glycosyltransferase involved in cell wall biosynthesis